MIWLGGLLLTIVGFILGRVFSQSEAILAEKRRVYEAFLIACPSPNDIFIEYTQGDDRLLIDKLQPQLGPLLFYASPSVSTAVSRYLTMFGTIDVNFSVDEATSSPEFQALFKAQNDIVLEMRRDALGWSVFGHRGKSRLPPSVLSKE